MKPCGSRTHTLCSRACAVQIRFTASDVIWPWTGHLGLSFQVTEAGRRFEGTASGTVIVQLDSVPPVRCPDCAAAHADMV